MISTGIVRSIDSLGRVVLPKELRTTYDITPDTPLEIFTDGDSIIMRKYHAPGQLRFLRRHFSRRRAAPRQIRLPRLPQGTGQVRPALPVISPLIQKKPVQANCTGSYFWFYSAFFSPRMASSAFLTRLKRLVAWRG